MTTEPRRRSPRARKQCNDCKAEKPLGCFHRCRTTRDGRVGTCKLCKRAYDAERRQYKADRLRAVKAAWRARPEVKVKERAYHAAWRKSPRGRECLRIARRIQRAAARAAIPPEQRA